MPETSRHRRPVSRYCRRSASPARCNASLRASALSMPTQPAQMADRMSAAHGAELTHPTRCCRSRQNDERQQCSGSGRSWPTAGLTVSATFRSFKRPGDCGTIDRSQGTADIVGRRRAAEHVPVRQLNRGRRHLASKADRMSAGRRIELAHPTESGTKLRPKADVSVALQSGRKLL